MSNAKEIQNRINGIKDTMKITRAMYMMSSMKLRKAKQKLEDTLPFFDELQEQIGDILYHFPDMQHIYFDNREKDKRQEVKKKGFIVITGDKGMAGAYNHNVIKEAARLADQVADKEDYRLYVVGEVGRQYFGGQGYPIDGTFRYSSNNPSIHRARVITEYIVDLYRREQLDEVYVIFTKMVNSIREEVVVQQLLPLKTHQFLEQEHMAEAERLHGLEVGGAGEDGATKNADEGVGKSGKEYIREDVTHDKADDWYLIYPSPKVVLEKLVYNYVTGYMYCVLVEGFATEENARMMAMQSATDNAEAMLKSLSVEYNRVRQAAITQEITEVIGGAKALKKKKNRQGR
jgi:F-type H+-transporting ATPase subunit gamma